MHNLNSKKNLKHYLNNAEFQHHYAFASLHLIIFYYFIFNSQLKKHTAYTWYLCCTHCAQLVRLFPNYGHSSEYLKWHLRYWNIFTCTEKQLVSPFCQAIELNCAEKRIQCGGSKTFVLVVYILWLRNEKSLEPWFRKKKVTILRDVYVIGLWN